MLNQSRIHLNSIVNSIGHYITEVSKN